MTDTSESLPKPSRQVDVKALLSHIIKGDGMDKCRICLGDTSHGQVHLEDTVMMDGEKPVTLAELLELITGVQVQAEEELPSALCLTCTWSALEAENFKELVRNAQHQWTNNTRLLEQVASYKCNEKNDKVHAYISDNNIYVTNSYSKTVINDSDDDVDNELTMKRASKRHRCSCPMCGKKFSYPSRLYEHLKDSSDLVRACHVCAQIMSRNELIEHLKTKHDVKTFDCQKCQALFLNRLQLKSHTAKAHGQGGFTCGSCSRTFQTEAGFRGHQNIHNANSCPNCDVQFRNHMCYCYHIKKCCNIDPSKAVKSKVTVTLPKKENKKLKIGVRGSGNRECICDYCKKSFAGKKCIAAHIKIVHTKETHRPCAHCGKLFAHARMTTHLKTHQVRVAYKCEYCKATLRSKLGYSQHLRLHTGEKPYVCKICGDCFSASSRRSEHIYNVHKKSDRKKYDCTECTAKFKLPHQLQKHLDKVHDNKGQEWQWECGECKEKFSSCRSLMHHKKKHKAETLSPASTTNQNT